MLARRLPALDRLAAGNLKPPVWPQRATAPFACYRGQVKVKTLRDDPTELFGIKVRPAVIRIQHSDYYGKRDLHHKWCRLSERTC